MLKKIAVAVIAVLLFGLGAHPAAADGGTWDFWLSEGGRGNTSDSHFTRMVPQNGGFGSDATCYTLTTGDCSEAALAALGANVWAQIQMPLCQSDVQDFCIEGAQIYHNGSQPQDATFVESTFANSPKIYADAAHGIPEGGEPLIFNSSTEVSNNGSHDFLVQVFVNYSIEGPNYVATMREVKISAYPVIALGGGNYYVQKFDPATRVGLSIRMPNEVGGWFKGRLADVHTSITPFDETNYRMKIDALNVSIPEPKVHLDSQQFAAFQTASGHDIYPGGAFHANEGMSAEGDGDFKDLDLMKPFANDTNDSVDTAWYLSSFASALKPECQSSGVGLTGLVATNAAVYTGAPPQLGAQGLSYQVGGLHFMPDGVTAAQGNYDLLLREDVARCIYGLADTGTLFGSTTVQDGASVNPATVSFGIDSGYVHFSATGFHFSKPIITSKLSSNEIVALKNFAAAKSKFSGSLALGKNIKLTLTGLPSSTTRTIQWYSGTKKITGAKAATLKVVKTLVGKKISVVVTLSKNGYVTKKLTLRFN